MHDTDRIRNLLGTYCDLMDAGDFAAVGQLFARGRLADIDGRAYATGAAEVEASYATMTTSHGGTPRTKHLVLNTVFDEPAADGSVTARSSYLVLQALEGFALQPIITGRYVDRFAPDGDGTWHFVERRFAVDLTGDLSHHLARRP